MLNLIEVSRQLIQYILPTEIVLETIGNFTNIFIFTRKTLRSFNCSLCFLCSSIVSLLLLYPTCIIDLIKNNYSIDIVSTSFNVGLRQLSNLRNARYAVDHNGIYVSRAGFYTQFNIIFANVVYSYIPPSFLLIFGFLILLNVKQNRRRILPIVQSQQQRTNIELMKMLIIQKTKMPTAIKRYLQSRLV
ncbi:unnamed protein product [Adineta steineri]|nr:unnamed protein product [Adineta steineri]CAF3808117.1 unnamed protein product [Adineta steineri]CAF4057679.1 unnamed protein product [Adineta steineri]CAF4106189.1 unnamed protein product [Adineta steineri]